MLQLRLRLSLRYWLGKKMKILRAPPLSRHPSWKLGGSAYDLGVLADLDLTNYLFLISVNTTTNTLVLGILGGTAYFIFSPGGWCEHCPGVLMEEGLAISLLLVLLLRAFLSVLAIGGLPLALVLLRLFSARKGEEEIGYLTSAGWERCTADGDG
jgi:hypothetical protein